MKFSSKGISLLLLACASAAGYSTPALSQTSEKILFNCFLPPQHYYCADVIPEMGRRIEAATEGRVSVNVPPKSLAAPPDQLEGVTNGVMDGALSVVDFLLNDTVGLQLLHVPFQGREDAGASSRALFRTYEAFFSGKPGEFEDVELLGIFAVNGSDMFSMTDQPIDSVESIANRKMFGAAGVAANVIKLTGSSVISGPVAQMLETISNGLVDGYAAVPWSTVFDFKLAQYTKSGTRMKHKIFQGSFAMFVSREKWARISEEDQAAIHAALGEDYSAWIGKLITTRSKEREDQVIAEGVKVIEASPEFEADLIELSQPMIDAWKDKVRGMGIDPDEVIAFFSQAYDEALAQSAAK